MTSLAKSRMIGSVFFALGCLCILGAVAAVVSMSPLPLACLNIAGACVWFYQAGETFSEAK